jgi:superfamily II DNA or RNA helicase
MSTNVVGHDRRSNKPGAKDGERWLQKLERLIPPAIRKQGMSCFLQRNVQMELATEEHLQGFAGPWDDEVFEILVEGDAILVDCTCNAFQNSDLCKHVWAALLEADGLGALSVIDGVSDPTIMSFSAYESTPTATCAPNAWKQHLDMLRSAIPPPKAPALALPKMRIIYAVDVEQCGPAGALIVRSVACRLKKNGEWGVPNFNERSIKIDGLEETDQRLIALLSGSRNPYEDQSDSAQTYHGIPRSSQDVLIPMLCDTGRFYLRSRGGAGLVSPLHWDKSTWSFHLVLRPNEDGGVLSITGVFRCKDAEAPVAHAAFVTPGLLFLNNEVARLDDGGAFEWIAFLRQSGEFSVPLASRSELLKELAKFPKLPPVDAPEDLRIQMRTPDLYELRLRLPDVRQPSGFFPPKLRCEIFFHYGGVRISEAETRSAIEDSAANRLFARDKQAENAAMTQLAELGVSPMSWQGHQWEISQVKVPSLVHTLVTQGWRVEAEGKLYRTGGNLKMQVTSRIDWFELEGAADFDGHPVRMPELLQAIARGERTVLLADGSLGMIPEDWLKRWHAAAGFAQSNGGALRFARHQAGLLDALLASEPAVTFDEVFMRVREELQSFAGIGPADPSSAFRGQLREYQREGLGWLLFLRRFGFGGCLADDMGLGKTIQVLALLDSGHRRGPALIVVPRSLVFNWKQEAARFAPALRILDQTGVDRKDRWREIDRHDVILATYGTLRRDAPILKDIRFDTIILDEAQAIKNANTESAKAVRLLKGDHRLVLTGTPVENRLTDLWALFEFLNPGMLGSASVFRSYISGASSASETASGADPLGILSRALRPFILRRTKEQVARELPAKTEQTIYCELDANQRRLYDELRSHYRDALLGRIEEVGMDKSRMHILEALLRLRQAACHPGLIDKSRVEESSAKLDALLPQIAEVAAEGHKALVFSQFTSLLSILRKRLDRENIAYEYLDGKTRDREARVRRFQECPNTPVFLVSLKAGGVGLNLTAAEYVFLLDPWWNPAVEAQAIDRTHRIGQSRHVFAYRFIARDSVEEKVLQLQQMKREMADAIITAENSIIAGLSREHLELLLS